MPPLTGDLPIKHPAVMTSVMILVLGYLAIGYEEHLKTAGVLTVKGGPFALLLSVIGLPIWAWLMLNMVGRPDLFFESRPNLVNQESNQRKKKLIRIVGYALQTATLAGLVAMLVKWVQY
jgi:hypothetical protein